MSKPRIIVWAVIAFFVMIGAFWAFWPRPILVDLTDVSEGPMEVAISEEGEARVHDLYVVFAPATGYLRRVDMEPGDCAYAGETRLAVIHSSASPALDARTVAQLRAAASSARAGLRVADAEVRRVQTDLDRAKSDLERVTALAATGTASSQALERAQADFTSLQAAFGAAQAARELARHEVTRADAALIPASQPETENALGIAAPVTGLILRVLRDSEGPVLAGEPILEIGRSDDIEIMVDLLSEDAVSVSTGDRVRVRGWGGPDLWGHVRLIEPYAFTKVSALGIEEQRANVAIDLDDPATGLGHGYRVRTDILIWQNDSVLQVPMTALFKSSGQWSVYKVEAGRARLVAVEIGRMNTRSGEVIAGLNAGDRVVEHPSSHIEDGIRVKQRTMRDAVFVQDQTLAQDRVKPSSKIGDPCSEIAINPPAEQFGQVIDTP